MKKRKKRRYHPLVFSKEVHYHVLSSETTSTQIWFSATSLARMYIHIEPGHIIRSAWPGSKKKFYGWMDHLRDICKLEYDSDNISFEELQVALHRLEEEKIFDWLMTQRISEIHYPDKA